MATQQEVTVGDTTYGVVWSRFYLKVSKPGSSMVSFTVRECNPVSDEDEAAYHINEIMAALGLTIVGGELTQS